MNPITEKEMKILLKAQQGELDAVLMYNALADTVKDPKDAETLRLTTLPGASGSPPTTTVCWFTPPEKTLRAYSIVSGLPILPSWVNASNACTATTTA